MTHDQTTLAPVEVRRMDHDRALEVLNDILCDMGNYVEFGAPHYKQEALETIASHCARHRIDHSAPAGEVEPVAWMYSNADDLTPCVSLNRWKDIVDGKWVDGSLDWTETPLYTHPAPPADLVELVEAAKPFAELAVFYDGPCEEHGENGCPDSARAGEMLLDLTVGQFRALRAALAKHGGA